MIRELVCTLAKQRWSFRVRFFFQCCFFRVSHTNTHASAKKTCNSCLNIFVLRCNLIHERNTIANSPRRKRWWWWWSRCTEKLTAQKHIACVAKRAQKWWNVRARCTREESRAMWTTAINSETWWYGISSVTCSTFAIVNIKIQTAVDFFSMPHIAFRLIGGRRLGCSRIHSGRNSYTNALSLTWFFLWLTILLSGNYCVMGFYRSLSI